MSDDLGGRRPMRLSSWARRKRQPIPVTERVSETVTFNEDSLRAAIVSVWGEHGAHADVFDHIVNEARRGRNTQGVLDAYKDHHEHFHPTCNIGGPPAPPRPKQRPFA